MWVLHVQIGGVDNNTLQRGCGVAKLKAPGAQWQTERHKRTGLRYKLLNANAQTHNSAAPCHTAPSLHARCLPPIPAPAQRAQQPRRPQLEHCVAMHQARHGRRVKPIGLGNALPQHRL